jgi:hypothetical protein
MKCICMRLGINKVVVSVEHQQSNVLVENTNKMIKIELSVYVEKNLTTWDTYLRFVIFGNNMSKQRPRATWLYHNIY